MPSPRNSGVVGITGGLGNQLFQLAYAVALSASCPVYIDPHLGSPRVNSSGDADIYGFNLPKEVSKCVNTHGSWVLKKISGYLIRSGIYFSNESRFQRAIIKLFPFALLFHLRSKKQIVVSKGVGFDSELLTAKPNSTHIGYFQTYFWANQRRIKEMMMRMAPVFDRDFVESHASWAKAERPLILHIRLGDYRTNSQFGHLTAEYYLNALEHLQKMRSYDSTWLFSDEPEIAAAMLKDLVTPMRIIETSNISPAAVLQVMRFGHAYVISNSTFSWWGAFLTFNEVAPVVAPKTWFNGEPEPLDLIPKNWIRLS